MTKQNLENTIDETYQAGLQACDNVVNLEKYMKEIKSGKKNSSSLDFNQLASTIITNGEHGDLFINAQPARIEGETKTYIKNQKETIDTFVTNYKEQLTKNYISALQNTLNQREDIKKIKEKLASAEGEDKVKVLKELEISAAQLTGFLLSDIYEEVSDSANDEIKGITQEINGMKSWTDEQKESNMDKSLTKRYNLRYGTKGLDLDYNRNYDLTMAINYRQLGSNFVSVDEQGNIKVNLDKYKDTYATNENLKKTAALFVSMIREANMRARQSQE